MDLAVLRALRKLRMRTGLMTWAIEDLLKREVVVLPDQCPVHHWQLVPGTGRMRISRNYSAGPRVTSVCLTM
jgi:hypothetical protein